MVTKEKYLEMFLEQFRARIYPDTVYNEEDLEWMIFQSEEYLEKELDKLNKKK